jgi:SAM-dependent methyltransferase
MNIAEYEKMHALEDTYWWFQGRKDIIRAMLDACLPSAPRPGRVLDVGCGTGLMLKELAHFQPVGLDFSTHALQFSRSRGLKNLTRADVVHLPFADNSFDLILALDLMEHVKNDQRLIREFHRVLRPGGCLMATVPAHPYLWSDHDIALHHFRRYTAKSLRRLLATGKLRPLRFSYCITIVHPPIVIFRLVQKTFQRLVYKPGQHRHRTHLIRLPQWANKLLIKVLRLEASLLRRIDLPVGTSLITLAQKKSPSTDSTD